MKKIQFLVRDAEDGGFVAVGDGIVTQSDTLSGLFMAIRESVECHGNDAVIVMSCELRVSFADSGLMSEIFCSAEYI